MNTKHFKTSIVLILKLLITISIIAYLSNKINLASIKNLINTQTGLFALSLGIALTVLHTIVSGIKLMFILKCQHYDLKILPAVNLTFIGNFFSQAMISFVGGDVMRIWYLMRSALSTSMAASLVFLDRVVGFMGLFLLLIISLPFLFMIKPITQLHHSLVLLAALCLSMSLGFIILSFYSRKWNFKFIPKKLNILFEHSHSTLKSKKNFIIAFCLGVLGHLLHIFTLYYFFSLYNVQINFLTCLTIGIPALLISVLPISIAGWGVRETSMITGFSLVGISPDISLTVSVLFGISLLIGSLPGALQFFLMHNHSNPLNLRPNT